MCEWVSESGRTGALVGVEARALHHEAVVLALRSALEARADVDVRHLDLVAARQEQLDDLVVVVVRREDQRRDVRRELRALFAPVHRADARPDQSVDLLARHVRCGGDASRVECCVALAASLLVLYGTHYKRALCFICAPSDALTSDRNVPGIALSFPAHCYRLITRFKCHVCLTAAFQSRWLKATPGGGQSNLIRSEDAYAIKCYLYQ